MSRDREASEYPVLGMGRGCNLLQTARTKRRRPGLRTWAGHLYAALGSGYRGRVHFIGHNLGALVGCVSGANFLHGVKVGIEEVASPRWAAENTHLTLLDEAEVGEVSQP
jgi:hypothetical protein